MSSIGSPLRDQENVHIHVHQTPKQRRGLAPVSTPLCSLDVNKLGQTPRLHKSEGEHDEKKPCLSLPLALPPDHKEHHELNRFSVKEETQGAMKTFGQFSPLNEMRTFVQASPAELTSPSQTFKIEVEERPQSLEWVTEKIERCVSPEFAPFTGTTPSKTVNISDLFSPVKSPDTRPTKKTPTKVTFRLSRAFEIQTEKGEAPKPIIPNRPAAFLPESPKYLSNESIEEESGVDFGQCTSPIKQLDQISCTTPVELQDTECQTNTSAVHTVDVDSQTGMSYAYLIDASMLTSPTKTADATSLTTPIRIDHQNQETSMTPLVMVDMDVLTTPTRPKDPAQDENSSEDLTEEGTAMTPGRFDSEGLSEETTNDAVTHDVMTTPTKMADQNTFMTPVCKKDASMLTSPIGNMALRLSDPVLSSLTPLEMRKQLEMALISNELFRTELTAVQDKNAAQLKEKSQLQAKIREKDEEVLKLTEAIEQAKLDTKLSMEVEITSLQDVVREAREQVSTTEVQLTVKEEETKVLKCENANLQDDLARIYKQHKQEIADLHAEYQQKDYKPHFEKAQIVIRKLEAEVETYLQLSGSVHEAEKSHDNYASVMEDKFHKLKTMEERMLSEREHLNKDRKEFMEGVANNEMAVRSATTSCERMKREVKEMKARLDTADRTIKDSQLYQDEILMELKVATEKLAYITQEYSQNKRNLSAAEQRIEKLVCAIGDKDDSIFQLEKEKLQLHAEYQSQNELLKNGQFFSTPSPASKPRETMDFLQQENNLLSDSVKEYEQSVNASRLELSRCQNQLKEKINVYRQLEEKHKQLNEKMSSLQAELDNTKTNAHFMLLSQGAELADVSVNVTMLKEKVSDFQEKLKITAARVLKGVQTIPTTQMSGAAEGQGHSFVSMLLKAADGKADVQSKHSIKADSAGAMGNQTDLNNGGVPSKTEPNNNMRIGSGHSAFAKVTPGKGLSKRGVGVGSDGNDSAFVPVSGKVSPYEDGVMNGTRIETQDMSLSTSCAEDQEPTIKDEVEQVIQILDVITELVSACDQARDRMFHTVHQENQQLLNQLEMRQSGRTDMQRLRKSVEESERDQIEANVKLLEKAEELEECQAMLADMRAKCNELSQQIIGHTEQEKLLNKLNEELEAALTEIKYLKSERSMLEDQLDKAIKEMDKDGSTEVSRGQYLRDITALRKELFQVKEKYIEKEQSYQTLKDKASRRCSVLEQNWKLAEDEVLRMDGLIEQIRSTLHENAVTLESCSPVYSLIRLLDGGDAERSEQS